MKRIVILIVFVVTTWSVSAQVTISEDYLIERIMHRYAQLNKSHVTTSGWRIQVFASTDRRRVEAAYAGFQSRFPGIPCEWKHIDPYYKLRAGAYQTRLEAIAALEKIKVHYRTAFPTIDKNIKISELLNN